MSHLTPPWCLHWGRDGELARSDRRDIFLALASQDNGFAPQVPAQAGPAAKAEKQPSHGLTPS